MHRRFIFRQLTRSGGQPFLFMICVMLSIQGWVALDGFGNSVRQAMLADAKSLHAADIIIRSNAPLGTGILSEVKKLQHQETLKSTRVYEFYAMARSDSAPLSLLAAIKVVGPQYPFYGNVVLRSGEDIKTALRPGSVIVEQGLLDRLNLKIGDPLGVGSRNLNIVDVVVSEPDRPVNFLSFGPRIFVSLADAESLQLMISGSRVAYKLLLKVTADIPLEELVRTLEQSAINGQEQINTFQTARSRIKRFFDNFFFFLTLIVVFTLLLAGFGIRSTLVALIRSKRDTIAVMKAIGSTSRALQRLFIPLVLLLGLVGTLFGLAAGKAIETYLPVLLGSILPATMQPTLSWSTLLKGMGLGLLTTLLFAMAPMERLKEISPLAIFRKETGAPSTSIRSILSGFLLVGFFTGLILFEIEDVRIGLRFLGGLLLLIALTMVLTKGVLGLLRHYQTRHPAIRLALRGLIRPGGAAVSIIVTLSVSLGFLFTMHLVETNMDAAFLRAYPEDAPNLFFVNIQPGQKTAFATALKETVTFYPIIRARLVSINNEKINHREEKRRRGDNLSRPFNLTYRDHLLEDESLINGKKLFQPDIERLQVSVLDTVVGIRSMKIGDTLTFNIQGVPVTAVISSIRTRTRQSIKPFFYFVFPAKSAVQSAPQTIFTALRLNKESIPEVQHHITTRFPNVSAIDMTQTLETFSGIARRLATIVRFFTAFGLVAGLLIVVSSVLATRWDRIQEAAYLKLVGAQSRFVLGVCALEHLFMGLISALMALAVSQCGSYLVCRYIFDITYHPHFIESSGLILVTLIMVVAVGLSACVPVVKQKPIAFLRNETGG